MDIKKIQMLLKQEDTDGWLFYDFQKQNMLGWKLLQLDQDSHVTRRIFYWIPKEGTPCRIVHAIEKSVLDKLPGEREIYSSWESLNHVLKSVLKNSKKVAMEYSKDCSIPYVSKVDGGIIDLIRNNQVEVVSSANILQCFTSVLDDSQIKSHKEAAHFLNNVVKTVWKWIGDNLNKEITEYHVQQKILKIFEENDYITTSSPICAVNQNSADPHYEICRASSKVIKEKDFLLIDLWAKKNVLSSIYADLTKVATVKRVPTKKEEKIFSIVRNAQKQGVEFIRRSFKSNKKIYGYMVDNVCRSIIKEEGFLENFVHRTGHNIDEFLHGFGANFDDFETHDNRKILKNMTFAIEPAIYLEKEFGMRLEHDIVIEVDGSVNVTGGVQDNIYLIE